MSWLGGPDFEKLAKKGESSRLRDICLGDRNADRRRQAAEALASMGDRGLPDLVAALVAPGQQPELREHIRLLVRLRSGAALTELVGILLGRDSRAALEAMTELGLLGNEAAREPLRAILTNVRNNYGTYAEQISLSAPDEDTLDTADHFTRLCSALHLLGDSEGLIILIRVLKVHAGNDVFARAIESCLVELTGQRFGDDGSVVPWLAWYESVHGALPDALTQDEVFAGRIARVLLGAGLTSIVRGDDRLECRIDHGNGRIQRIFVVRERDLGGLDLVCIRMLVREVPYPLPRSVAVQLLRINFSRMVGAFQIRRNEGRAVLELEHRILHEAFDEEDFLGAFGTIVRGGAEYIG